ncbi:BF3164 family lipoprotein [Algoriphagus sp. D3-2-R+10]|uniref:BF3164 family lipoprotein n=1 Tax=Algoriphagus aurantiacus TaxID=3103948 RepID=UPI002B368A14|nr:BF3164 family lipoprotein [Algoriphagus sp. D3-2-R+10]MEB2777061.1 BF3164 family lipoprotein [Algoriphagus sp. D3-2-R+10]
MKSTNYALLFLILFASCRSDDAPPLFMGKHPTFIAFEKSIELTGEHTSIEVIAANNIEILDTLMIFTTPALNTLYYAISTKDYKWSRSFIGKGEGPNEFEKALIPLSVERKDNDLLISFYHKARQGLFHYNLTQSFNGGNDLFQDTIPLNSLTDIYKAYQINEEEVLVDNMDFINLNQHYSIYNWKDQNIVRKDSTLISGLNDHGDSYLLATNTIFSKSQLKYAGAMVFVDQLNIYDLAQPEKSLAISVSNQPNSINDAARTLMPFKKEFYVDLREANNLLFGLYANLGRKEWATGDSPAVIHVIDWEGNPICKLSTKEKLVKFDIDPENNMLYGLTEKQEVYKYDLSKIPELAAYKATSELN